MRLRSLWGLLLLALVGGSASAHADPACRAATFEGDGFTVCRYAPSEDDIHLVSEPGAVDSLPRLKRRLGEAAGRVRFAMNAGMYHPDLRPVGLFIAEGRAAQPIETASGAGNFFLKPNGVFWVGADGVAHVAETGAFEASGAGAVWATQSGPLLLEGGRLHRAILPNGPSLAVRNAVGVDGQGGAVFVISDRPVSFGRLARLLRDALECPDALYLDGSVSSLWSPERGRLDRRAGLGPFVVVLRKAETAPPP